MKSKQVSQILRDEWSQNVRRNVTCDLRNRAVDERLRGYSNIVERVTYHDPIQDTFTVRNLNKSHRQQTIAERRSNMENTFMLISMKVNRAENQRNERRAKR